MVLPYRERRKRYLKACFSGDIHTVRSMLSSGVSKNDYRPGDHDRGLHICSRHGTDKHVQIAELLLAKGANFEIKNKHMKKPLDIACENGNTKMINLLFKHGAETNLSSGKDFLEIAIYHECEQVLEVLIDKGHRSHYSDPKIKQILERCFSLSPNLQIIKLLVLSDILWTKRDPRYLWLAIYRNNQEVLRFLAELNVSVCDKNEVGLTPLQYLLSTYCRNVELVLCVLEYGALDYISLTGKNALHDVIIHKDNNSIIKVMLNRGFSCNVVDTAGKTPLQYAISLEKFEAASILLDAGAKDNIDNSGWSTLHYAVAYCDRKDLVMKMIRSGFKVNARTLKSVPIDHEKPNLQQTYTYRFSWPRIVHTSNTKTEVISKSSLLHMLIRHQKFSEPDTCELMTYLSGHGIILDQKDSKGYLPLHVTVKKKLVSVVKTLITVGANIDDVTEVDLNTPLHIALTKKYDDIASLLLSSGADVNMLNRKKETSLYIATKHGFSKLATQILQNSFHHKLVNKQDDLGNVSLIESIKHKMDTVTLSLLHMGARVNLSTHNGETPLHAACKADNEYIVKQLINRNADVNAKDISGNTPLSISTFKGNFEIVKALVHVLCDISSPLVVRQGLHTFTLPPIYYAVINQNMDICHLLMDNGANVDCIHYQNNTVLHLCVEYHDTLLIQKVVNATKEINVQNDVGETPLHIACKTLIHTVNGAKMYQIGKLAILLNGFADPNIQNKDGDTPLHIACRYDCQEVIRRLLDYGAFTNALNKKGQTSLTIALRNSNLAIALLLLRRGTITDPCFPHGKNLIREVIMKSKTEQINFMLSTVYGVVDLNNIQINHICQEMYKGLAKNKISHDMLLMFLRFGVCPNTCDELGRNALHYAVLSNREDRESMISLLLEFNANINQADAEGNSPLLLACEIKDISIIQSLLYRNASIYTKNNNGQGPAHLLCAHFNCKPLTIFHTFKDTIDDLCKQFRPILNSKDKMGQTVLHYALKNEELHNVAETLIKLGCDVNVDNGTGLRPLGYVFFNFENENHKFAMVELMMDYGLEDHTLIWHDSLVITATRRGRNRLLEKMVEKKFNMNKKGTTKYVTWRDESETALDLAIKLNRTAVPLLLLGGINVHSELSNCGIVERTLQSIYGRLHLPETDIILLLRLLSSGAKLECYSLQRLVNQLILAATPASIHLIMLLHELGHNFTITSLQNRNNITDFTDVVDLINEIQVKRLERLAANTVRKVLIVPNIWYGSKQVGLPGPLRDLVTFNVISRYQECVKDNDSCDTSRNIHCNSLTNIYSGYSSLSSHSDDYYDSPDTFDNYCYTDDNWY